MLHFHDGHHNEKQVEAISDDKHVRSAVSEYYGGIEGSVLVRKWAELSYNQP